MEWLSFGCGTLVGFIFSFVVIFIIDLIEKKEEKSLERLKKASE